MRKLYILFFAIFAIGTITNTLTAQQDAMFTKYMFNQLSYNPAYAGSYEFMSINAVYRNQWWAFEGAPESQTFTIHAPIANNKIGIGLSIINDKIGPTGSTTMNLAYAYHIPIGAGKLSVALQGGVMNYRADFNKLDVREFNDVAFDEMQPNKWLPNFGGGLYYYSKYFYVGASVPHILNNDLRGLADGEEPIKWAMQYRHYYFMAGGMVPISPAMKFKPSLLIKNVGLFGEFSNQDNLNYIGAPTEYDFDASVLFYDTFWVGASIRGAFEAFNGKSSMDSGDIWAAYYLKNGLRVGLSYDYTLTILQVYAQGSFDVMLGYDFSYKEKKIVTPRYF